MEHNIQLKQTRNTYLSGVEDTKQARAAMFPSLSASTSQSLANYPSSDVTDNNMYTGSYNLNASMTVFQGGSLSTALKQQKVQNEMDLLSVEETANDIRIAIVQAYMQCLYAAEAVKVSQSTAEASKALKWFEITGKDSARRESPEHCPQSSSRLITDCCAWNWTISCTSRDSRTMSEYGSGTVRNRYSHS